MTSRKRRFWMFIHDLAENLRHYAYNKAYPQTRHSDGSITWNYEYKYVSADTETPVSPTRHIGNCPVDMFPDLPCTCKWEREQRLGERTAQSIEQHIREVRRKNRHDPL